MKSNYEILKNKLSCFNDILKQYDLKYEIYLFGASLGAYHLKDEYRFSHDLDYTSKMQIQSDKVQEILNSLKIRDMVAL